MSHDALQKLAREISITAPRITLTIKEGKLFLGLRVFSIKGDNEQQIIDDIVDHLKYVAEGLKLVIGEPPFNKIEFISKPLYETKQRETALVFQRASCSCCHSDPHKFSITTPIESRQEDIELDLMMSAFQHMLSEN